jgi:NAD(P)H-dependent flavin oxidoreductase YrpB (nitropropane dioxygenase family)
MGVGVSAWALANAVARTGQIGVVSGTALDVVCARRLQDGDPGGAVRRALAQFPLPGVAERILRTYYLPGGRAAGAPYRPVLRFSLKPPPALVELTVAANFVEVFLAKEGHRGTVGINYLRKIELSLPYACYGAMLAGVDHVLVGAGNPADLPALLDGLAALRPVALPVRVQGATSADGDFAVTFDPRGYAVPGDPPPRRPRFQAIVGSVDLAAALAADPATRPDGFVVEGSPAGGHNAPPRGPRRLDGVGQPVYDERDVVSPGELVPLGLPYWLAGGYGTPQGLAAAVAAGATGVQVGTAFAFCRESGMDAGCKAAVLELVRSGAEVPVRTDPRASPTGFPFKVIQLPGTLADEAVYAARTRLCDLGALRAPYRKADGGIGYRCPAEPVAVYERRGGGRAANTAGRRCICNGLVATAGFPQTRADGYVEPPIVTAGTDFTPVRELLHRAGPDGYTAADVVAYLLGDGTDRP